MKVCSLAFTMYIPAGRVFRSTVGSVVDRTKRPMQLNRTTGVVNLPESYRRIGVEVFIDCSYEGDFMAKAGVSYAVGHEVVDDVIGWAAYMMDSHNCDRLVVNGVVKNEGNVEIGGFPPYPISYRALVPKRQEVTNLLVPVCLSASHIAYGSIRMEPVFMVLGQSAADAVLFLPKEE